MESPSVADLIDRIERMLRLGTIAEVDHANALCRVSSGALTSAWLPWFARRAGQTAHWSAPTVGEQCMMLSPGGNTAAAVVLVGMYSDARPAPDNSASSHVTTYPDGATIRYDHASHMLDATLPDGSNATLTATCVTINANDFEVMASSVGITADSFSLYASDSSVTSDMTISGDLAQDGDQSVIGSITVNKATIGGIDFGTHGHRVGGIAITDHPIPL